jgi:soluble lytic murein transglycosylase-like protein
MKNLKPSLAFASAMATLLVAAAAGAGGLFVYQLPDGSRVVTDHPVNPRNARLVGQSEEARGVGRLAANRPAQNYDTDPSAYDRLIHEACGRHRVDPALVKAVIHAESLFDRFAVSNKGALGLMQLMPGTAQRFGVEDIYNPRENIEGGVRYLRFLTDRYGKHNMYLVLAAYNAGENAVARFGGIPPYPETRDYVRKVLSLRHQYSVKARS